MRRHGGHFADQPFVGIPFHAISVDLVLESVTIQDRRLVQEPFVTANVKFNFSLPIPPAGNRLWMMHTAPQRRDVETLSIVRSAGQLRQEGFLAGKRRPLQKRETHLFLNPSLAVPGADPRSRRRS